jgi:PEP-CTERM motif
MSLSRPLSTLMLLAAFGAPLVAHADPRYTVTIAGAAGSTASDNLNKLLDPASGSITEAAAINDVQQIAATSCRGGSCYALRLDPVTAVPEPTFGALLLAGLGVCALCSRRSKDPFQSQPIVLD